MYRILTTISGGVTGNRSAFLKNAGKELRFDTRYQAERFIELCARNKSEHQRFTQTYTIEEV